MDLQKDMQDSRSETCPTSRDANQIIIIKVEDVSDREDDPMPLGHSRIKTEHAVSCMSLCHC
jgi:hypothetical protein